MNKRETIKISDSVIIETAKPKVTAIASEETLSNLVSPVRYQLEKIVDDVVLQEICRDANGDYIREGEEFTYIDDSKDFVYRVYQKTQVFFKENGKITLNKEEGQFKYELDKEGIKRKLYLSDARPYPVGEFANREEAIEFAKGLEG